MYFNLSRGRDSNKTGLKDLKGFPGAMHGERIERLDLASGHCIGGIGHYCPSQASKGLL